MFSVLGKGAVFVTLPLEDKRWQQYVSVNSLFSRAYGILGKGGLIVPYWANRLFYPTLEQRTDLQLIVSSLADCQALT